MPQQRFLPGADLAGDDCETGPVHHPEFQHGIGQTMTLAPIDQVGVGQNRERLFAEPVERLIHSSIHAPRRGRRSINHLLRTWATRLSGLAVVAAVCCHRKLATVRGMRRPGGSSATATGSGATIAKPMGS